MMHCDCKECKENRDRIQQEAFSMLEDGICEVEFVDWNYKCGDGCCDDYGTTLIINGHEITCGWEQDEETTIELLEFLGHSPIVLREE